MILDEVDAGTRAVLERYGFDAEAFETLRARVASGELTAASNVVRGVVEPPRADDVLPLPEPGSEDWSEARAAGIERVICEVDRLDQIEPALAAGANHILLDNMGPAMLREAVGLVDGRVPTEASGGVRLDTIGAIAASGVNFVSVGRLTQSAPAADIGLDFTPL